MAVETGTTIVLVAGGITFTNEWLQTHAVNWRVLVATALGGAVTEAISHLNAKTGTGIAIIVLIGAVTVPVNGKSPAQEFSQFMTGKATQSAAKKAGATRRAG